LPAPVVSFSMRTLPGFAAALALLGASATAARAERTRDIFVCTYVTEAGKKLTPPTPDHPATYILIPGGYREEGQTVAGEKPPPPEKVDQFVRRALAAANYHGANVSFMHVLNGALNQTFPAGYDPAKSDSKEIDYIIVYHWGYMNPEKTAFGDNGDGSNATSNDIVFNQPMMLALVAGGSIAHLTPDDMRWGDVMQAANENRYFLVITAYSPAGYFKHHEKRLLWRAQMSLDSDGTDQTESMPALASASVNYLGRQTNLPEKITESLDRPSEVIIGPSKVKEYLPVMPAPVSSGPTPKKD